MAELKRKDTENIKSSDTHHQKVVPIRLNVGGKKFMTTYQTLSSRGCTYFQPILDGADKAHHAFPQDDKGRFFLDRSPQTFSVVLEYLRNGVIIIPDGMKMDQIDLEFKFFGIPFPHGDRSEYTDPWKKRGEQWVEETWPKVLKLLQEETPVSLPFVLRVSRTNGPHTLVCDDGIIDSVPFWYFVSCHIRHRFRYEAIISPTTQQLTLSPIDREDLAKSFSVGSLQVLRTHFTEKGTGSGGSGLASGSASP